MTRQYQWEQMQIVMPPTPVPPVMGPATMAILWCPACGTAVNPNMTTQHEQRFHEGDDD